MSDTAPMTELIEVTAPMDLKEGYNFDAQGSDGSISPVAVPLPGGVIVGKVIPVPFQSEVQLAPVGRWRYGLFECWSTCCSPLCCMAFWCNPCQLGQVMTRLNLNWAANPTTRAQALKAFTVMFVIAVLRLVLGGPISVVTIIFLLVVRTKTRAYLRSKYEIPPGCCGPLDDLFTSCFCSCCATIQMARHTHDERLYPSAGCTPNGLQLRAPELPEDISMLPLVRAHVV